MQVYSNIIDGSKWRMYEMFYVCEWSVNLYNLLFNIKISARILIRDFVRTCIVLCSTGEGLGNAAISFN